MSGAKVVSHNASKAHTGAEARKQRRQPSNSSTGKQAGTFGLESILPFAQLTVRAISKFIPLFRFTFFLYYRPQHNSSNISSSSLPLFQPFASLFLLYSYSTLVVACSSQHTLHHGINRFLQTLPSIRWKITAILSQSCRQCNCRWHKQQKEAVDHRTHRHPHHPHRRLGPSRSSHCKIKQQKFIIRWLSNEFFGRTLRHIYPWICWKHHSLYK